MQIGSSMDEAEFTERVVPCVSKLFTSTDRSIRRSLLENIDAYGKHLSQVHHPSTTLHCLLLRCCCCLSCNCQYAHQVCAGGSAHCLSCIRCV